MALRLKIAGEHAMHRHASAGAGFILLDLPVCSRVDTSRRVAPRR
jgi:hypothetical protein